MKRKLISLLTAAAMVFAALPVVAENTNGTVAEVLTVEETAESTRQAVPIDVETEEIVSQNIEEFEEELSQMSTEEDKPPVITDYDTMELFSTSGVSTLVSYIEKYGTSSDDDKEITYSTTTSSTIYTSTITYSSSSGSMK